LLLLLDVVLLLLLLLLPLLPLLSIAVAVATMLSHLYMDTQW
jgi:hypothetical protein